MFGVYGQPLDLIIKAMLIGILIWTSISIFLINKRIWVWLNRVLCVIAVIGILLATVLGRPTGHGDLELRPFYTFVLAKKMVEYYRNMLMNVFLFFPLGLTLPYAFSKLSKHTILLCALLSLVIEIIQLVFKLGRCEVDDLIMNTLGGTIGYMSYFISSRIRNRKAK